MKIAIIGLGQMGGYYVNTLLKAGVKASAIVGVDIDPAKVAAAKKKFPSIAFQDSLDSMEVDAAIVATNTPSHHPVLISLMERNVRWLICEKPLGIDMSAINQVRDVMLRTKSYIFTAFLMNFSPALLYVIDKMQTENLVLAEGSVVWGKNRYGDKRPTPGDLEDETVHGAGVLHNLCVVNQEILSIAVMGRLTHPTFASAEAQAKAHALDPSFPTKVNASTMVIESISTNKGEVLCNMHSSFIGSHQVRRVTAVLSRADNPSQPVYTVEFNFDVKTSSAIVDHLTVTTLDGNTVERLEFVCDKLSDQTKAFMAAARGDAIDPRLTDYNEARKAVAFTEAVLASHQIGGGIVSAYTMGDVVDLKQVAA